MVLAVVHGEDGSRLEGDGPVTDLANRFLAHLSSRGFSPATVRGYAYDLLNFSRFLAERDLAVGEVVASDIFGWLDWQAKPDRASVSSAAKVVRLADRQRPAAATMNRRVAAARGLFEYAVICGVRADSPVPVGRRSSGARAVRGGLLGHVDGGRGRRRGRLVREPRRLPDSVEPGDVATFLADLGSHRDRAMTLLMVLGGLRAAEVRSLRLANVDMGRRQVRVIGKGSRERVVPVDGVFFSELAAYLRTERPPGCPTPECFVVLRGPTAGAAMTEAGMRKVFRVHRDRSGATRVRPHRLRHTYGTELAAAGMDLLVLRQLMGHVSPDTTASYVHLAPETLAAEYAKARAAARL